MRDGKVWLFAVAEHWNAEALGWHVAKRGTRREALQAMGMAVQQQFAHLGRDAARGVQLRHDHGSCFMAEDFQTQLKAWGMTPSYAFVGQPETNGVIERFFRMNRPGFAGGDFVWVMPLRSWRPSARGRRLLPRWAGCDRSGRGAGGG